MSCLDLQKDDLLSILQRVLYEFPVRELDFAIPRWVTMLEKGHWLQNEIYTAALQFSEKISRMKDVPAQNSAGALAGDSVQESALSGMNLSDGVVRVTVLLKPEVFYRVLSEQTGLGNWRRSGPDALHRLSFPGQNGSTRRSAVHWNRWKPPATAS